MHFMMFYNSLIRLILDHSFVVIVLLLPTQCTTKTREQCLNFDKLQSAILIVLRYRITIWLNFDMLQSAMLIELHYSNSYLTTLYTINSIQWTNNNCSNFAIL